MKSINILLKLRICTYLSECLGVLLSKGRASKGRRKTSLSRCWPSWGFCRLKVWRCPWRSGVGRLGLGPRQPGPMTARQLSAPKCLPERPQGGSWVLLWRFQARRAKDWLWKKRQKVLTKNLMPAQIMTQQEKRYWSMPNIFLQNLSLTWKSRKHLLRS